MKYKPPVGVVGYADKKELRKTLESGSSYNTIGLDHPDCWEDEPPYEWLVALCAVDDMFEHDAKVIQDFCSFALSKYRYDISGFADEFLKLRQKAQEKSNGKL